jgi:hypothetical protein
MKAIWPLLALIAACFSAEAQTNYPSTNVLQLLGFGTNVSGAVSVLEEGLIDAAPYITNDMLQVGIGPLYNGSDPKGKFGFFADATVPIGTQAGFGITGAYLNSSFLCGSMNLKLGTTVTLPVIGPVFTSIYSGPQYDFQTRSIGAYSFAGAIKKFDLNPGLDLIVGGGVGNISTLPGVCIAGEVKLCWHF